MSSRLPDETAGGAHSPPVESPAACRAASKGAPSAYRLSDDPPPVFSKTLRLFLFPPMRVAKPAENSPFSEQILNWMRQGDRLADARPPELVDLRDLDPVAPGLAAMVVKRSPSLARSMRRWLTVAAAAAVFAGVVWAARQSATLVDRPAFAAGPVVARRAARAPSSPTTQAPGARTDSHLTATAGASGATQAPSAMPIDPSLGAAAASKSDAAAATRVGHQQRPATAAKHARRARR